MVSDGEGEVIEREAGCATGPGRSDGVTTSVQ